MLCYSNGTDKDVQRTKSNFQDLHYTQEEEDGLD